MLEIALIGCGIISMAAVGLAAFFYAEAKAEKRLTVKQAEWLEVERKEKLEWAAKALARVGQKPLHHVPDKKEDLTPARRIITRAEARQRTEEQEIKPEPKNITYPRVQETVEKAGEILNQ
jgi:hypothetical protein